ncbi:hypothetical protein WGC32_10510 [Zongyangia sp. HA2173]|uniref:anti-sigma-I factor RsgI family protein n=1 Tax=Zongyangia sp. HA2173 TaxID=3133035 RepID=UPI0031601985
MSYLVMECHPGYAVLLDEEGRFFKAANLQYEVGQRVYDPVLMREEPQKQSHTIRWIGGAVAAIAACLLLVFGIGYYQNYLQPYSSIYLTINPEVQMDLNRQGTVVDLTGTNEDGEKLLEGYDGKGKDKVTVADELIDRAIAMGFLSEGGQISFSIDSPDEAMFQEYGMQLRTQVEEYLDGRMTVMIEIVNYQNGQGEEAPEEVSTTTPLVTTTPPATTTTPPQTTPATTPAAPPPATSPNTGYGNTDYGPGSDGDSGYSPGSDNGSDDSGYDDDDNDDGGDSNYDDEEDDD